MDSAELPIKLHAASNAEFAPPNATDVVDETARRAIADGDRLARRLGLDRRRFFRTLSGAALCLATLDACSKEKAKATGQPAPGGTFDLSPSSTTEPAAAKETLAGQEFIFDVQTHLLPYDLTRSSANFGSGFPQSGCGERDQRACFDVAHFLDALFLQSDTSAIVISALPLYGDANPLTTEAMEQTRAVARQLCDDDRVLIQAQAAPTLGSFSSALEAMDRTRAQFKVSSWKTYTSGPTPWRFDDRDRSAPQVGQRFLDHIATQGPRIVAVHKGFGGAVNSPADIGPAAAANPRIAFLIYHSGYDSVPEGPYDAAKPNAGVDRLVKSLDDAGVRPGANVYAELGSTWRAVMSDPTQAAHVLGKLLLAVGEDRVLWGTDSIWYGSPQDQIQAFRAFQITSEFQERFGYPQLTAAIKAKILGLNAARLYGIDPKHVSCRYTRDELQAAREARRISFETFGPSTRRELAQMVRRLGPVL